QDGGEGWASRARRFGQAPPFIRGRGATGKRRPRTPAPTPASSRQTRGGRLKVLGTTIGASGNGTLKVTSNAAPDALVHDAAGVPFRSFAVVRAGASRRE